MTNREEWTHNSRIIYTVDTLGFEEIMAETEYYPDYSIPTGVNDGMGNTNILITLNSRLLIITSLDPIYKVELFNYSGIKLYEISNNELRIEIDVRPGILFVRAINMTGITVKKLIIF